MAYTLGSVNGKALNSFEFMQLVENGELIKYVAPEKKEVCCDQDVLLRPGTELIRADGSKFIVSDGLDAISAAGKTIKSESIQKHLKIGMLKIVGGVEHEKTA